MTSFQTIFFALHRKEDSLELLIINGQGQALGSQMKSMGLTYEMGWWNTNVTKQLNPQIITPHTRQERM